MKKLSPKWKQEFKDGKTYFFSETQKIILNKDISGDLKDGNIPSELLSKNVYIEDKKAVSKESVIKYAEYICLYETDGANAFNKIKSKTVMIVGLGGIGSEISLILAGSGVEKFVLIDTDKVEENNFNRQFLYTRSDIGIPKVEAAAKSLGDRHKNLQFDLYHDDIKNLYDSLSWGNIDFVVVAFDRESIYDQIDFMEHCWHLGIPVIYATTGFDKSYMSPIFKKEVSIRSPKNLFLLCRRNDVSNISASSGALNSYTSAIAAEQICYYLAEIYEKVDFNNILISCNKYGYPIFKKFDKVYI